MVIDSTIEKKTKRHSLAMTASEAEYLDKVANHMGLNRSSLMQLAIRKFVREQYEQIQ